MIFALFLGFVFLIAIYAEFLFPSGFLALLALGAYTFSVYIFSLENFSNSIHYAYALGLLLSGFLIAYLSFLGLKKSLVLRDNELGSHAFSYSDGLVGKEGIALTDHNPSGFISIDQQQIQATSLRGYISKGDLVQVVEKRGSYVVVKQIL